MCLSQHLTPNTGRETGECDLPSNELEKLLETDLNGNKH